MNQKINSNILISGAGIAGLTVAYWLKQFGFTPIVLEKAPTLRTGGYKIDVRGKALDVLRRMSIYDAVFAARTDMQGASVIDRDGKIVTKMSGDEFGFRTGDDLEIIRGKLCEILRNQVSDVEYIFDDSIQAISQFPDKVEVQFKKNGPRSFDLVIGADGLHSNVRRLVFGDENQFADNLGLYLCVFTVPNYLNLDRWEIEYTELGKRMVSIWSTRGDKDARACFGFVPEANNIDAENVAEQQQLVRNVYKDLEWEVPRLLEEMPKAPDFYFDSATHIRMDRWSKGRVALIGDAGYCPSPMSGQGTSVALIGAYVLAGELMLAKGDYQKAFEQYEQELRPFVKANQDLGKKAAALMKATSKKSQLFIWVFQQLQKIMPSPLVKFVINRSMQRIHRAANAISLKNYELKNN